MQSNQKSETESGSNPQAAPTPVTRAAFPVPDHELIRCIAVGSYGEVWLARNTMGTFRAVKVVRRQTFKHARPFERELAGLRKFEPISRSHEGFVDVLHIGHDVEAGFFYYIMELGDDLFRGQHFNPDEYQPKTLEKWIAARKRLPIDECVRTGLVLAEALRHLHENELSHRDIKPSNIIFVHGAPKLADIGLVATLDEARTYVGTEGFIAPEGPGKAQADIFSLGMVFYEMSTGNDRHSFPALPGSTDSFPDAAGFREFNELILRACDHNIRRRYQSADELCQELELLKRGSSLRRLRMFEKRWQVLRAGAIGAVIALGSVSVLATRLTGKIRFDRDTQQRQIGSHTTEGLQAMSAGDMLGAASAFIQALKLPQKSPADEASLRMRLASVLALRPKLKFLSFVDADLRRAEMSSDQQGILVSKYLESAQVWDVNSGKPLGSSRIAIAGLRMAAYSPDGQSIITAAKNKTASLWDAATAKLLFQWHPPAHVAEARFSPDGTQIVAGCDDGKTYVWERATGKVLHQLGGHTDAVLSVCFSPSGRSILTTSRDNTARIWSAIDGQPGLILEHPGWVYHGSFSPDGREVVTACLDRQARVWDLAAGKCVLPTLPHADVVVSSEFSPDGCLIATAGFDGMVRLWTAATHQPIDVNPVLRHSGRVRSALFAPGGHQIVTACSDGTVRIWDLAANSLIPESTRDDFSPDGARRLTVGNQAIQIRDANSARSIISRLPVHAGVKKTMFRRRWRGDSYADDQYFGSLRVTNLECSNGQHAGSDDHSHARRSRRRT